MEYRCSLPNQDLPQEIQQMNKRISECDIAIDKAKGKYKKKKLVADRERIKQLYRARHMYEKRLDRLIKAQYYTEKQNFELRLSQNMAQVLITSVLSKENYDYYVDVNEYELDLELKELADEINGNTDRDPWYLDSPKQIMM